MELRKKVKANEELDQEAEVLNNYCHMYIVLMTMNTNWVELTIRIHVLNVWFMYCLASLKSEPYVAVGSCMCMACMSSLNLIFKYW